MLAGQLQHPRGYVERSHRCRARSQASRQPADAAADLEHRIGWLDVGSDRVEQQFEITLAVRPESRQIGVAVIQTVVDEEERVLVRPLVPEAPISGIGGRRLPSPVRVRAALADSVQDGFTTVAP